MPIFEKKYANYMTVYKFPVGPNQLDPTIFYHSETDSEPKLHPTIQAQIDKDVQELSSNQPQRVKNYYLVGASTNPGAKNRTGALRVIIEINKDIKDIDVDGLAAERLLQHAKQLSGRLATGTVRPIEYSITVRPIDKERHTGIYNVPKFCWEKLPSGVNK